MEFQSASADRRTTRHNLTVIRKGYRVQRHYNARRDSLKKLWRQHFGHQHCVVVVERFYENVDVDCKNKVLQFQPRTGDPMYVASLWARCRIHAASSRTSTLLLRSLMNPSPKCMRGLLRVRVQKPLLITSGEAVKETTTGFNVEAP